MNQQKTNNTLWYSLGLAALLCICFLVSTMGIAMARYRSEQRIPVTFQIRVPARIYQGTMQEREVSDGTEGAEPVIEQVFVPNSEPEKIENGDKSQWRLVIANGTSETDFSEKGQYVRLRLFGTLGLWSDGQVANITVQIENGSETLELEGRPTFAEAGSVLYSTHGEGWIYTFHIPETEEEYVWTLPGGAFNHVDLLITVDSKAVSNLSLLNRQIISELITD